MQEQAGGSTLPALHTLMRAVKRHAAKDKMAFAIAGLASQIAQISAVAGNRAFYVGILHSENEAKSVWVLMRRASDGTLVTCDGDHGICSYPANSLCHRLCEKTIDKVVGLAEGLTGEALNRARAAADLLFLAFEKAWHPVISRCQSPIKVQEWLSALESDCIAMAHGAIPAAVRFYVKPHVRFAFQLCRAA
jgi:hypothetical protein